MNWSRSVYGVELARMTYGLALLAVPGRVARTVTGAPASDATVTVVRVLGVRHVAQAALTLAVGGRRAHGAAAAVDLLHLASLAPIAAVCERRGRRLVAADAPLEALFAAAEIGLGSQF